MAGVAAELRVDQEPGQSLGVLLDELQALEGDGKTASQVIDPHQQGTAVLVGHSGPPVTLAGGDLAVLEVELTYADGNRYLGTSILELRDGKVVRETDYYAQPFQAPEWRPQWVERM
jgi:hypothetical protein